MPRIIMDSSAIIALLNGEQGGDRVAKRISDSIICTVNVSEVFAKQFEAGKSTASFEAMLGGNAPGSRDFTLQLARESGRLRPITKPLGLSLGDRACLALALQEGLPVMTADRDWTKLAIGVTIECIR